MNIGVDPNNRPLHSWAQMPRLTHSTYLAQRDVLRELWVRSEGRAFAVLLPLEQWDLHEFFAIRVALSDEGLREQRKLATTHDLSLPQRAGRALKNLNERLAADAVRLEAERAAEASAPTPAKRKYRKNANRTIRVRSVVHPQPDAAKFARALLDLAKELAEKERREQQRDRDAA